jgi:hypothetical protein
MEEWKKYLWQECGGNYSKAINGWHDKMIGFKIDMKKFWSEDLEKSDRKRYLRPTGG